MTSKTKLAAWALSVTLLLSVGACGGGAGETGVDGTPEKVTAPGVRVSPPAGSPDSLCGASAVPLSGAYQYILEENQTLTVAGVAVPMTRIISPTGHPSREESLLLGLGMPDLRAVPDTGYTPHETADSMGVRMDSGLAAGAVGCVTPVSRLINIGTQAEANYLLSWTSALVPNVPVGLLPHPIVNGFELTHNFVNKLVVAQFRISKSLLSDTTAARICYVNTENMYRCDTPEVADDGQQWTFTEEVQAAGLYFLVAPKEPVL